MCNSVSDSPQEIKKSLLDDEAPPLPDEPVDLSKTLHQIVIPSVEKSPKTDEPDNKTSDILAEFDVINKVVEDEDDQEFALLAAASLSKAPTPIPVQPLPIVAEVKAVDGDWKPFGDE